MFMKHDPTRRNMLEARMVHPLLGTSHSKSVGGRALKTSIRNQDKTGGNEQKLHIWPRMVPSDVEDFHQLSSSETSND